LHEVNPAAHAHWPEDVLQVWFAGQFVTHALYVPLLALHVCVPLHWHDFGGDVLVQAQPSFGIRLQLASLPATQVSAAAGSTWPAQAVPQDVLPLSADNMHVRVPDLQGALLLPGHGPVVLAGQTHVGSWLSGNPLQSLSMAEVQSRAFAVTAVGQAVGQDALVQVWVPGLQIPIAAGPQGCVSPLTQGQPSFAVPLQLASFPLVVQLSAAAGLMLQAPHLPPEQVSVPAAQLPSRPAEAQVRGGSTSRQVQPSLGVPLQVASSPLVAQLSAAIGCTLQVLHLPPAQVSVPAAQLPRKPSAAQERVAPLVQPVTGPSVSAPPSRAAAPPLPPPAWPPLPALPPLPPAPASVPGAPKMIASVPQLLGSMATLPVAVPRMLPDALATIVTSRRSPCG